jgi:hypothetical protein
MPKYRKKPVVIEAVRWRGYSSNLGITSEAPDQPVDITMDNMGGIKWDGLPEWLPTCLPPLETEALTRACVEPGQIRRFHDFLHIGTLEGVMAAAPGDWIICGIKGEIYPCKPDIFEATYDPA